MKSATIDPMQGEVIEAEASARIIVHAGPGTGKTHVAALRLTRLVGLGLGPGQILVLSFSRSAVRTLARRLECLTKTMPAVVEDLRHMSIRTFDSWTFRILRQLGERPEQLLLRTHEQNIAMLAERMEDVTASKIRALLTSVRHIVIDEFQDIPGVRGRLVLGLLNLLAPPGQPGVGFTVLGDPAQAIYAFAVRQEPTEVEYQEDYWKLLRARYRVELREIELERNYRAVPALAEIAAQLRRVLRQNISGTRKLSEVEGLITRLPILSADLSHAWLASNRSGSVAILTRTNGEALRVAQKLIGDIVEGPSTPIRLQLAGYRHPVPAWIAALLAPLQADQLPRSQFDKIHAHCLQKMGDASAQVIRLPSAEIAWLRLVRACGEADLATSIDVRNLRQRLDWPDAFPDDYALPEVGLCITTIHQSKGMEFESVALLQHDREDQDERPEYPEEEANINFVAITRAGTQLGVIPASAIYQSPVSREFGRGVRTRLCYWRHGWVNLEVGIAGDISAAGFVDERVHGSKTAVDELQRMLLSKAPSLRGHKVMLCKRPSPNNFSQFVYGIHLQDGSKPGLLLGHTSNQLTWDLLYLLYKKGYSLPGRIMNLRIGEIVTMTGAEGLLLGLSEPYQTSRLWLGVTLFGTGDFKTWKSRK